MSAQFPIPRGALRCPVCEGIDQPGLSHNPNAPYCSRARAEAQLGLDGSVEEVEDPTPPSVRHLFPFPSERGEEGVLRDLDALERAGAGWWLST